MTTATDHKNNLNSSALKKKYARTLRVETIANSAGGTFFSSRLADVALRLGPYMSISSRKDILYKDQ